MIAFIHPLGKDPIHPINADRVRKLEADIGDQIWIQEPGAAVRQERPEIEIAFGFQPYLTLANLRTMPNLKWLHSLTSGVNLLPFEYLLEKNILLTNSKGLHRTQISEQIIGNMISFTRGLHYHLRRQADHAWDTSYPYEELAGKTLCIVGTGEIGKELARKAKAFDMQVIGVRKHAAPLPYYDQVLSALQLSDAFKQSDFIAVLIPLTPETNQIIGEKEINAMKPTAVFMNYSRGGVVDEAALIRALKERQIMGAGLDVFHQEPLPAESPFWDMPNVLVSPHIAGTMRHQEEKELNLFVELYGAYQRNEPLPNQVNLWNQY